MKLILKLVVGIIAGIIIGLLVNEAIMEYIMTFQLIFGQFLEYIVPFIIIFFITSGVSSMGKDSGKLLGLTGGIAYGSTVVAGIMAFIIATLILPIFIDESAPMIQDENGLSALFELEIEPALPIITALITSFIFGIGIAKTNAQTLKSIFDEGKTIIEKLLWVVVIPVLPFYIASIFAELSAEGTVWETLASFGLVLLLALATHWIYLIGAFSIAGGLTGRNPFSLIKTMLPAYFTGIGTVSSTATIPVTTEQTKKNNVNPAMADAIVPLGANIHLAGSTITITMASMTVMMMLGELASPTFGLIFPFILGLGVIMIAAPGVPGGAIIAASGLLTSMLGFGEAAVGLMIALYMAQDSLGTGCNVTGDGAIALTVNRFIRKSE
ncbi:cation:dicarboxylate symporter family transporter [Natribacillus halophilus]|uniref:Na+/H+-dicarboxylate symporter n=1 Tax=Natribacillus halophilus TaxID=549003 RepID=A0A1G8MH45_9BACI|nr:cation:dicarboxylase symporter family transporter [Natribacillus halophilus]SDI67244.1 Na+/H+-dicarboxylate symporter [Natribacillus halophilus]